MNTSMKHQAPAARWAAALTAAFAMSQADAATAQGAGAPQDANAGYGSPRQTAASGNQHYLADDAALLEGPQHLWGVG